MSPTDGPGDPVPGAARPAKGPAGSRQIEIAQPHLRQLHIGSHFRPVIEHYPRIDDPPQALEAPVADATGDIPVVVPPPAPEPVPDHGPQTADVLATPARTPEVTHGGLTMLDLLPEAPLGIPLLAWIGGAIWLVILALMFL